MCGGCPLLVQVIWKHRKQFATNNFQLSTNIIITYLLKLILRVFIQIDLYLKFIYLFKFISSKME